MKGSDFMRLCSTTTPAVVIGAMGGVGLGVIRDLGHLGIPVAAVGTSAKDAALRSRYAVTAVCGPPHADEERFAAELVAIADRIGRKAVLFAADDDHVALVSRHKHALDESYTIPMVGWERMQRIIDKIQQLSIAHSAGVEVPTTAVLRSEADLADAAGSVPFPAVLKPSERHQLYDRKGVKVIRVDSRDDLAGAYARINFCETVLLQEVIPGPDENVLLSGTYHDADSRPRAVFTGRKIRQQPTGFGDTRAGESLWSDELADVTLRLLAALRYHGVCDVEFKRDARDGRLKLMEVNPRQGLWSPLARAAGVNLAYIAYRDAIGSPCPTPTQIDGVRWTDMLKDGPASLKEMLRGDLRPADWMRSMRGLRVDCYLSARDPLPGLVEARRIAGSHARRGIRRLRAVRGRSTT